MAQDIAHLIALTKIPKVGSVMARALVNYCGGAEAVFETKRKTLLSVPGIGETLADAILANRDAALAASIQEVAEADTHGVQLIAYTDATYPLRLRHFEDAPVVLHYTGTADLNHQRTVGIVGTRNATEYGKWVCDRIVTGLKEYNVLIVSGLAAGIDGTAHQCCVRESMPTIGVVGHGLDTMYPTSHRNLAKRMIAGVGGVLSEFSWGTFGAKENFPMRNRVIAALSDVVVVIESPLKGGSLITIDRAHDYKRDVFAVPGRVNEKYSEGCNALIKSGRATLVESASDIATAMRWQALDENRAVQASMFVQLSEAEQVLVDFIRSRGEVSIDVLSYETKTAPSQLAALILGLEFKGVVRALPGKRYQVI